MADDPKPGAAATPAEGEGSRNYVVLQQAAPGVWHVYGVVHSPSASDARQEVARQAGQGIYVAVPERNFRPAAVRPKPPVRPLFEETDMPLAIASQPDGGTGADTEPPG